MSTGEPVFRQFKDFQHWVHKASTWVNGGACLDAAGRRLNIWADFMRARDEGTFPVTIIHRVGKARAGRLLDGRTWDEMPEGRRSMTNPAPLYVRVADLQAVFGIHRSTIYKLVQKGYLTIHKIGAASLLRVAEVEEMILSGEKLLGDQKEG